MRVAHSRTSKLKNLPNLPKLDPCSEPWKRVTFVVRNWIFIVLTLHARSYLSCKNQRLDLLTLVTLTCQIQVEYRWNTGPAGQFVLIMWVAHSGTSKLKNLPNLPKLDPCSEPWKRVTFVVRNWIFIVLTLHARSYLSCKNQRLDMLSLVTLTCQIQVEYRWNTGPAGQFVLISGVPCYTYNFKCPVSIRLKLHVCIPI